MENVKSLDAGKNTVNTNSTFCIKVLSIDRIVKQKQRKCILCWQKLWYFYAANYSKNKNVAMLPGGTEAFFVEK